MREIKLSRYSRSLRNMLKIQFDPVYDIYDAGSVLKSISKDPDNESRFEKREIYAIVAIYYQSGLDKANEYVQSLPANRQKKISAYVRKNNMGVTTYGGILTIVKPEGEGLRYGTFAKEIVSAVAKSRMLKDEEISYIIAWYKESGLTDQTAFISAVQSAYSLNAYMTLDELFNYVNVQLKGDKSPLYDQSYRAATNIKALLGLPDTVPTKDETRIVEQWLSLGFTEEEIEHACMKAVDAGSFEYIDVMMKQAIQVISRTDLPDFDSVSNEATIMKELTGLSGREFLNAENIIYFHDLRQKYDTKLIRFAADTVRRFHNSPKTFLIYIHRTLESWNAQSMTSDLQVDIFIKRAKEEQNIAKRLCDITGIPYEGTMVRKVEMAIGKWLSMGFTEDSIISAAQRAGNAEKIIPYINQVLKNMPDEFSLPY